MPPLHYLDSYKQHARAILTNHPLPLMNPTNMFRPTLAITINNNTPQMTHDMGCFENRHSSLFKLIQDASQQFNLPDMQFVIHSDDNNTPTPFIKFGLSHMNSDPSTIMFPCWGFDHWRSTGLHSYQDLSSEMLNKPWEERINKMLWAGNTNTHRSRHHFVAHAPRKLQNPSFFDLRPMHWTGPVPLDHESYTRSSTSFTPIQEYANYRYALDMQGNGYSARVKYLLLTGSTLCLMDRPFTNEFYMGEFVPNHDYVALHDDYIELVDIVNNNNEEKYKRIAANGQQKARDILTYENVLFNIKSVFDDVHLHRPS